MYSKQSNDVICHFQQYKRSSNFDDSRTLISMSPFLRGLLCVCVVREHTTLRLVRSPSNLHLYHTLGI